MCLRDNLQPCAFSENLSIALPRSRRKPSGSVVRSWSSARTPATRSTDICCSVSDCSSDPSAAMHAWTRPRAQAWAAFVLLLLAGKSSAQSLTSQTFKSPTGESVKFLGDSVSLKYYPAASANCSQCYLAFKLGALSELDAVRLHATDVFCV